MTDTRLIQVELPADIAEAIDEGVDIDKILESVGEVPDEWADSRNGRQAKSKSLARGRVLIAALRSVSASNSDSSRAVKERVGDLEKALEGVTVQHRLQSKISGNLLELFIISVGGTPPEPKGHS